MNIDSSLLKIQKSKNPFKNPYHLTFFNHSLARKCFNQKTINININNTNTNTNAKPTKREITERMRTPDIKKAFNAKFTSSKEKVVPKSKTPKLQSICKINKVLITAVKKKKDSLGSDLHQHQHQHQHLHCEKKENGYVNITISHHPQTFLHNISTTRNSNVSKNLIKKDNAITKVNIKIGSEIKKAIRKNQNGETNNNNNRLTATLLSKDVRLKMLQNKNKDDNSNILSSIGDEGIGLQSSNVKETKDYNNTNTSPQEKRELKTPFNEYNGRYLTSNLNPQDRNAHYLNNSNNNYNHSYENYNHPFFKQPKPNLQQLNYNPKNQYRELIGLYLISEDQE